VWLARRYQIEEVIGTIRRATPQALDMAPPDPTEVTTAEQYNDALKRLREWSGSSFHDIWTPQNHPERPPASTLCSAFARGNLPARDWVESFLRSVEFDPMEWQMWLEVWQALHDGRTVQATPAWKRWRAGQLQTLAARAGQRESAPGIPIF